MRLLRPVSADSSSRILIFGGGGYVGSVLSRMLLQAGHEVTIFDRFFYGDESIRELYTHARCHVIQGDTRDITAVTSAIAGADAVVHLAELVGDPLCARDPQQTLEINYLATSNIVRACAQLGVERFVYVSSCSVYGASSDPDAILTETSPKAPVSLYAQMKIAAENAILSVDVPEFTPVMLRLGTVFGISPRPRFDLVVNTLTAKAVREKTIPIFGGDQWRPHVHVADVARAICCALVASADNVRREVFNVISENMKIADLGLLVGSLLPQAEVIMEDSSTDKRNYRVSGQKARELLGFIPRKRLHHGILEIAEALSAGRITDPHLPHYNNLAAFQKAAA